MRDLSLVAQARAVLVANPVTRARSISVDCADGVVSLGGRVEAWSVRSAAEQALARVPGIREIRFLSFAAIDGNRLGRRPPRPPRRGAQMGRSRPEPVR